MLHKSLFTIDGIDAIFEGYTDGTHWNGWAKPWFTKKVADNIMRIINKNNCAEVNGDIMYYVEKTDMIVYDKSALDPDDEEINEHFQGKDIGGKHLYPIGNMCWVWDDIADYQSEQSKKLMAYLQDEYYWIKYEHLYDVYYGILREIDGYMSDGEVQIFADGFVAAYEQCKK